MSFTNMDGIQFIVPQIDIKKEPTDSSDFDMALLDKDKRSMFASFLL